VRAEASRVVGREAGKEAGRRAKKGHGDPRLGDSQTTEHNSSTASDSEHDRLS
jgi:hypothetical protein